MNDYFVGAQLIAIYHNTKIYMLDGILITYACNQTFKMHFMQLSKLK